MGKGESSCHLKPILEIYFLKCVTLLARFYSYIVSSSENLLLKRHTLFTFQKIKNKTCLTDSQQPLGVIRIK